MPAVGCSADATRRTRCLDRLTRVRSHPPHHGRHRRVTVRWQAERRGQNHARLRDVNLRRENTRSRAEVAMTILLAKCPRESRAGVLVAAAPRHRLRHPSTRDVTASATRPQGSNVSSPGPVDSVPGLAEGQVPRSIPTPERDGRPLELGDGGGSGWHTSHLRTDERHAGRSGRRHPQPGVCARRCHPHYLCGPGRLRQGRPRGWEPSRHAASFAVA